MAQNLPGGYLYVALYFLFVLWVWVARPVGNARLLFDPFARYALRRREKIEAVVVSSCLAVGFTGVVAAFAWRSGLGVAFGIGGIAAAFPFALIFTNASRLGRRVFASVGGTMLFAILLSGIANWFPALDSELLGDFFMGACIACAACTWLGNIRALYQRC